LSKYLVDLVLEGKVASVVVRARAKLRPEDFPLSVEARRFPRAIQRAPDQDERRGHAWDGRLNMPSDADGHSEQWFGGQLVAQDDCSTRAVLTTQVVLGEFTTPRRRPGVKSE